MREHVMALGTLKLVHAAELRKERDQRKESDQETESRLVLPALSPEQASVNGELKARVHAELAVFGDPEVEKRSLKPHSGNVYIENQTNEFVQETESRSPDQATIIRDLKAKIDAQAQAIRELEREKRSLQEECERLDSEGEIVGVAGRGGGQHVDGAPKLPQRRAGRSKGSKNRVSSAPSLTSPPIVNNMSLPEESDIFQGLSGRQVLQLKRKLKNNLITKAQAREEAMRSVYVFGLLLLLFLTFSSSDCVREGKRSFHQLLPLPPLVARNPRCVPMNAPLQIPACSATTETQHRIAKPVHPCRVKYQRECMRRKLSELRLRSRTR
jgi:hypothetical protein